MPSQRLRQHHHEPSQTAQTTQTAQTAPHQKRSVRSTISPFTKRLRRLSYYVKRIQLSYPSRYYRAAIVVFLLFFSCIYVWRSARLYGLMTDISFWFEDGSRADHIPNQTSTLLARSSEASVNLWRHTDSNCPPETNVPDKRLYGTGSETCYAVGLPSSRIPKPGDPASFWQMNSRAFSYSSKPFCLYGRSMNNLLSFDPRGSSSCNVVSVQNLTLHDARTSGLNESCAAFRTRHIANMFGKEIFTDFQEWRDRLVRNRKVQPSKRDPLFWASSFAIIIPKYPWSYNICHYNRIWNFVIWIIRNLKLFVPDADQIDHIHVFYRAGYQYTMPWHIGIRDATLQALQNETKLKITVAKLRFDRRYAFQCIRRGILLGREGRIDAFPFFNDTEVWKSSQQNDESHWPSIPHHALWLRQAVAHYSGLPNIGNFSGPHIGTFHSVSIPPRTVAVLRRSPLSKRRLTVRGKAFLNKTLIKLCAKYKMKLAYVRTSAAMSFKDQAALTRSIGVAVGLHGANMVNTIFMQPGGSLFEIFPWRYVRFYYASGANSGLRYSFHEPRGGIDRNCEFTHTGCAFKYRESIIYLTESDQKEIYTRLDKAIGHFAELHRTYPSGNIPLTRDGDLYRFAPP